SSETRSADSAVRTEDLVSDDSGDGEVAEALVDGHIHIARVWHFESGVYFFHKTVRLIYVNKFVISSEQKDPVGIENFENEECHDNLQTHFPS
ncbi:hypothetical protein PFISCL1PPCAC_7903, partial [Pristionchus fissidentatus]